MALKAINRPGKDRDSFTRVALFGISENATFISGREAEIVIMDIMVRLLTSNKVVLTCQDSDFIG
jgi:hypothetical protein